jgi:4-amino-4-deoxy-L-arabinose transferase-like glycosyltransferase
VETNQPGHQPSINQTLLTRIGWAVLIIATLYVCYFSHLGAIGFVGPDEPRYAWIARDMAESGDWVTPRLYGKPWFEKPPLLYWGAALSFKLFGVSEATARLPSAVSALLATLALAWLALRLYGAETARWLLLFLPTTVGMIGFSHATATDMLFSATLTVAMVAAAVVVGLGPETNGSVVGNVAGGGALRPSSGQASPSATKAWLALILFGFFLGLAVLAKGPAGIILCGGSIFFWAAFTKRWRDAFRLFHPTAVAAFCVTALPWYIVCAHRNPDFFRVFIIEHNFQRYLTPEFQHIQPFWYYGPILLAALVPWTLGFLGWCFEKEQADQQCVPDKSRTSFFLGFGLVPLLFFSISRSKLPGYILPAMSPLGCLLAERVTRALHRSNLRRKLIPFLFALTSFGLAIALERFASHRILGQDILPAPWTTKVWLPLLVAALAGTVLAGAHRSVIAICAVQIGVLLAIFGLGDGLMWMDPQMSARGVIKVAQVPMESAPLRGLFVYDLPRGIHYGLNFYFRRELLQWTPEVQAQGLVFTSLKAEQQLQAIGYSCKLYLVNPAAILCREKGEGLLASPRGRGQPQ